MCESDSVSRITPRREESKGGGECQGFGGTKQSPAQLPHSSPSFSWHNQHHRRGTGSREEALAKDGQAIRQTDAESGQERQTELERVSEHRVASITPRFGV